MEERRMSILMVVLLVIGVFVAIDLLTELFQSVGATTIYVDDDYPSEDATHKQTIQAAIDAASDGDTVHVYSGTYLETLNIGKTINLTGEDRETTIIDGGGAGDAVRITADWVNVTGFTINQTGGGWGDDGIVLDTVQYCRIYENKIWNNSDGIELISSHWNSILFNEVYLNGWMGIALFDSASNTITGNHVSYSYLDGISLSSVSGANIITYNNISFNDNDGISFTSSHGNHVKNNTIYSNQWGITITTALDNNLWHNNLIDNTVQATDDSINNNNWYDGYPSGGNYWSDYNGIDLNSTPDQNVPPPDGIGDTWHWIDGNSYDRWPLMEPYYDTQIPSVILISPTNNSIILEGSMLDFDVVDNNLYSVNYSINSGSVTTFDAPYDISTVGWSDGSYTIDIASRDLAGNTNQSSFFFVIDSTPPDIILNTPGNNSVIPSGVVLDFSIIDANLYFTNYSLNGNPNNPFSAPYDISTTGWGDGTYIITINATDLIGNTRKSWFIFTIDSTKPMIQLVSPGNNTLILAGTLLDLVIQDVNLQLAKYTINGGVETPLNNPYDISTAGWIDGDYVITINAIDLAGNSNSSWYFFTIDSTPPMVNLNSPMNNSVFPEGILLDFDIADPHLDQVNYSINTGPEVPFSAPYNISTFGWTDGIYTIQIIAKDVLGNVNNPWFLFTVDSTPPQISLNVPVNNSVIPEATSLNFSIVDQNIMDANYSINGGPDLPLIDPYDISTVGWVDGNYTITILAADMAGNVKSSWYFFTVDSTPPAIILNSPGNNSIIPSGTILNYHIDDLHLTEVIYSANGGPSNPLIDPFDITSMGWSDGDYIIQIISIDLADNSNSSSFHFTIDSTVPDILLVAPGNNTVIQEGTTLDFSISDVHLSQVEYSINGGTSTPISDPYNISTTAWSDGDYTIQINAQDLAGNTNSSWYFFTFDSSKPDIILNNPVNNSVISSAVSLDFSISDSHIQQVNYSVNGESDTVLPDPYDIPTTGWVDGNHTIWINAMDEAGNSVQKWFFFTLDSTSPDIVLMSPIDESVVQPGIFLKFSIIDINLFHSNYSIIAGEDINFSDPYDISTVGWSDGEYYVQVNAVDLAGNRKSSSISITIDSTKPLIALSFPQNNSKVAQGTILNFSITDLNLLHVNYSIDGGPLENLMPPYDIFSDGWSDGEYTLTINALDGAGNSNSNWFYFIFDSTPPFIWFDPAMNHTTIILGRVIEINITGEDVDTVEYSINEEEFSSLTVPYIIGTSDWMTGNYTILIRANDTVGNEAEIWFEVKIDATLPYVSSTSPSHQFTEFDIDGSIIITFSEDMNQSDIESYLSISPDNNLTFQWQSEDTLYISFDISNLALGTTYNLTIDGAIMDSHSNSIGSDFILTLTTKFLDSDNDGTPDIEDDDDDNDGYLDIDDAFPLDNSEWQDFDGDGVGDNADLDDDDDGHLDEDDVYPFDTNRWKEKEEPQDITLLVLLAVVIIVVVLMVVMLFLKKKGGIGEEFVDFEAQELSKSGATQEGVTFEKGLDDVQGSSDEEITLDDMIEDP